MQWRRKISVTIIDAKCFSLSLFFFIHFAFYMSEWKWEEKKNIFSVLQFNFNSIIIFPGQSCDDIFAILKILFPPFRSSSFALKCNISFVMLFVVLVPSIRTNPSFFPSYLIVLLCHSIMKFVFFFLRYSNPLRCAIENKMLSQFTIRNWIHSHMRN